MSGDLTEDDVALAELAGSFRNMTPDALAAELVLLDADISRTSQRSSYMARQREVLLAEIASRRTPGGRQDEPDPVT